MFTPDWNDAPEWANYVAMDEDGEWYWYENEPTILFSRYTTDGRCEFIETPKVWKSTLQSRPRPKIKRQFSKIDHIKLRSFLAEYGAWTDVELMDHDQNKIRALWLACCDISAN